jgi:superfamily I DNA and RNA helicase
MQLYKNLTLNQLNENIVSDFENYAKRNPNKQIYLLTAPLGEKYNYENEKDALVILVPKHKIIFLNLSDKKSEFEIFYEDFVEDLNSISDKYNYKDYIGRPRDWKRINTTIINISHFKSVDQLIEENFITDKKSQRISDLLISLLIGSINDIKKIGAEVPETLLEKVKKNIILFDGDQTRFIYQEFTSKTVTIQGLSGTGKTELLLHKLKDLYLAEEEEKIFFTCHNIALANTLRERIPSFFNFMKVEKQIEWNKKLWVNRAWGSRGDKNSGLYSYLCNFYNIPFLGFSPSTDYNRIFSLALDYLNLIEPDSFEYAFDYILIDERQDFPDVFFQVCEKVTRNKVYIAGDIFQDIFETFDKKVFDVDVILNKCYRTDPKTLMFAHAVGLGLFEKKRFNWFDDDEWEAFGYNVERLENNEIHLSREPLRRFDESEVEKFESVEIVKSTTITTVIQIIKNIIADDGNVSPNDIAIILLDDHKQIYQYIDSLSYEINRVFGWSVNRAHENKIKINNALYISNPNNVKGLEFPFVICITGTIKNNYRYRNILYTMVTRSFIKSFLLLNNQNIDSLEVGLKTINENNYIEAIEPDEKEKREIKGKLINFLKQPQKSYKEFIKDIFEKLKIEEQKRSRIEEAMMNAKIQKFDEEMTIKFINSIKDFY